MSDTNFQPHKTVVTADWLQDVNDHVYRTKPADGAATTFVQSGTGAVMRSMQDKAREWVTAKDYGALGDGATDDTAAFNKAALISGPVHITAGTYKLTAALANTGNFILHPGAVFTSFAPKSTPLVYDKQPMLEDPISAYDRGSVNLLTDGLPVKQIKIGARTNLFEYTENLSSVRYAVGPGASKQGDLLVCGGVTLSRLVGSGFYANMYSPASGFGLTTIEAGKRYLMSYFIKSNKSTDQFVWARPLTRGTFAHGAKLINGTLRRVWQLVQGAPTQKLETQTDAAPFGSGTVDHPTWFTPGYTEGGTYDVMIGGFMLEEVPSTYKDGIAMIGDSTMAGGAGKQDNASPANEFKREVSVWLGALLNVPVFNRAVGGERTDQMDARWAADITPLAPMCKYAIIQGGINDLIQGVSLDSIKASLSSMAAKATADGMIPVLFTCTPTSAIGSSSTAETARLSLNSWIKQTFANVIDIASVVEDKTNKAFLTADPAWQGDGIHYSPAAKRAIGYYAASWTGWNFIVPSQYQPVTTTWTSAPSLAFGSATQYRGAAAPTSGTYVKGDIVWNDAVAASGNVGWVCVTAGSPGTWKTFGAVSA